jgi:hypothetical protein
VAVHESYGNTQITNKIHYCRSAEYDAQYYEAGGVDRLFVAYSLLWGFNETSIHFELRGLIKQKNLFHLHLLNHKIRGKVMCRLKQFSYWWNILRSCIALCVDESKPQTKFVLSDWAISWTKYGLRNSNVLMLTICALWYQKSKVQPTQYFLTSSLDFPKCLIWGQSLLIKNKGFYNAFLNKTAASSQSGPWHLNNDKVLDKVRPMSSSNIWRTRGSPGKKARRASPTHEKHEFCSYLLSLTCFHWG